MSDIPRGIDQWIENGGYDRENYDNRGGHSGASRPEPEPVKPQSDTYRQYLKEAAELKERLRLNSTLIEQ